MLQLNRRLHHVHGAALFIPGLAGDCLVGILFLVRGEWQLFLWHFPLALTWAMGVNLLAWQNGDRESRSRFRPNKWGLTALLLGAGSFPGCGSSVYSLAFLISKHLFSSSTIESLAVDKTELPASESSVGRELAFERTLQPLVDDLYEGDTDARRTVVARISRSANPGTTQLLRQLLFDTKAEIRSDASIALARLDGEMSRTLNLAFEAWASSPTDTTLTHALVDQYYQYAVCNVLDSKSQRFYLLLARDLLTQLIAQEESQDAQVWLKLARIRQRLDELPEALQDVLRALQIQPASSEATLLAMELAFGMHSWDTLFALTGPGTGAVPPRTDRPAELSSLQWWNTLYTEPCGGAGND